MRQAGIEDESQDISFAERATVKAVVTRDWKSVSATQSALIRPISQTGRANPNIDDSVNNYLKLNEMQKQASGMGKNAGNQKYREICNFET